MKRLVILGAGGYGQTVADLAGQLGRYDQIVFLDDNSKGERVVGKCEEYRSFVLPDTDLYPAFGNNAFRLEWMDKITKATGNVPTLIHPCAFVSPLANIEYGSVILPKAVVNTGVHVQYGCIVNCGAIVDHGCLLERGVHICLGAIVKAENRIPEGMKVEAGEVIENRKYPWNREEKWI